MCMSVLFVSVCVCVYKFVCISKVSWRPEEGAGPLELELNLAVHHLMWTQGPMEEQEVPLTTEPFIQSTNSPLLGQDMVSNLVTDHYFS